MGAYWTVLCIISYLVGMYLGSKLNTNDKVRTEKIKIKNQKVLVIRPKKYFSKEDETEVKQMLEQIQPKNGKILLPNWCDYEFGEISQVIIGKEENETIKML